MQALKETVRTRDLTLSVDNTSVMIVGVDEDVHALDDDTLQPFIDRVENDENMEEEKDGEENPNSDEKNDNVNETMDVDTVDG